MIDLGSGQGEFALTAADLGWTVTALDAHGDRYPADEPRVGGGGSRGGAVSR